MFSHRHVCGNLSVSLVVAGVAPSEISSTDASSIGSRTPGKSISVLLLEYIK